MPTLPRTSGRNTSRAISPALSQKSRRSHLSNRPRYMPSDPTDDEDSDEELRPEKIRPRSRREILANKSARRGGRKMSVQSNFETEVEPATTEKHSRFTRRLANDRRGGSVVRSLHEYPITKRNSSDKEVTSKSVQSTSTPESLSSVSEADFDKPSKQEQLSSFKPNNSSQIIPKVEQQREEKELETNVCREWVCEHCTFVNDPSSRICAICCKTSETILKTLPSKDSPNLFEVLEENQSLSGGAANKEKNDTEGRKDRKISFLINKKAT